MDGNMYRIGIDLGGTTIKVGLFGPGYKLLGKKSGRTDPAARPWQAVISDMALLTESLLSEHGVAVSNCEKLGVGSPGLIDHENGIVVFAGNFDWVDVPLLSELRRYFSMPMRLANDANCAVLGEVLGGAAKGAKDVVLLTLGTGVGGGVVAGGVLQEGGCAGGMELGHTLLVMDGEACTCGRRGCLEAYASANALMRQACDASQNDPDSKMWALCGGSMEKMTGAVPFAAAKEGDETAKAVVAQYVRYLGEGIIDFINLWRPEKVLLGGGVSNAGDALTVPLNEYVRPRVFAGQRAFAPPIIRAALGADAGLYGAAGL